MGGHGWENGAALPQASSGHHCPSYLQQSWRVLLRPKETLDELWPVLLLLALHDWIGISKAADRVWLLSEARERFRGITG